MILLHSLNVQVKSHANTYTVRQLLRELIQSTLSATQQLALKAHSDNTTDLIVLFAFTSTTVLLDPGTPSLHRLRSSSLHQRAKLGRAG